MRPTSPISTRALDGIQESGAQYTDVVMMINMCVTCTSVMLYRVTYALPSCVNMFADFFLQHTQWSSTRISVPTHVQHPNIKPHHLVCGLSQDSRILPQSPLQFLNACLKAVSSRSSHTCVRLRKAPTMH